jgi:hypothetical protein
VDTLENVSDQRLKSLLFRVTHKILGDLPPGMKGNRPPETDDAVSGKTAAGDGPSPRKGSDDEGE